MIAEHPASTDTKNDPLQQVAAAMSSAAEALKDGASDAAKAVQRIVPQGKVSLSKAAYSCCYFLSYGVAFPTLFVTSLLPTNNPLSNGLHDGAAAAGDMVKDLRSRYEQKKVARRESLAARAEECEAIAEGVEAIACG
ncbi:MAG: hypothetical protein K2Y37_08495 [Pirellulales bacterium]|nr:hypothetical protein [Pirellulales bacterium]